MYALIKDKVLSQLSTMQMEISRLHYRAQQDHRRFPLLADCFGRLQSLAQASQLDDYRSRLEEDHVVDAHITQLRAVANAALCDYEKYQVSVLYQQDPITNDYLKSFSQALHTEIQRANIQTQSSVLLIGSGALPTTAFALATSVNAQVICYDHDPEAQHLAHQLVTHLCLQKKVHFIDHLNALQRHSLSHIIISSLVADKAGLLQQVTPYMNRHSKLVMRYGNGMKAIFNYPYCHHQNSKQWRCVGDAAITPLYDLLILESAHDA